MDRKDIIIMSPEELLWLIADSKREWQRKARSHQQWRQRKDCFGEMQVTERPRKAYIPPKDHPWRRRKINTYS